MTSTKKKYFISDAHLGLYPPERSAQRERILVEWLDSIKEDAEELYLLGDIFDFWHEYRHVVPRGFIRFLGKLAELADKGVKLHFFTGNHDIWMYGYLPEELGLTVYRKPISVEFNGKKFFLGHGDGLDARDKGYRIMKWGFTNPILQWLFARIHPNASMAFGKRWSKSSRYAKGIVSEPYNGDDHEHQVVFARSVLTKEHFDYFIFGHRHIAFDVKIAPDVHVVNLGDWIVNFTFAVWDGQTLELKSIYPEMDKKILRK